MAFRDFFKRGLEKIKGFFQKAKEPAHDPIGQRIISHIGENAWVSSGSWANVQSSWVTSIRYNIDRKELFLRFNTSNLTFGYSPVSPEKALSFYRSSSLGRAVHSQLKPMGRPAHYSS